jgi:CDP-diacylglycerol--serine O-phosphatidyltransferase
MVTFGVAPAVMVAIMAHYMRELKPGQYLVVWIFCAVYMGCAALRLATYNVHAILEKKSGSKFTGLPSPGAAAAICATVIFSSAHNYLSEMVAIVLPAIAAILGILMVSSVPYIHAGKLIASVRRNKKVLFFLFACAAGVVLYGAPTVMFIVVSAYILSGPLGWLFEKTGLFREAPKTPAADSPEK